MKAIVLVTPVPISSVVIWTAIAFAPAPVYARDDLLCSQEVYDE